MLQPFLLGCGMRAIFRDQAWFQSPFIRISLSLITGILLGYYRPVAFPLISWIIAIAIAGLIIFSLLSIRKKYMVQWAAGICIHTLLICAGIVLIHMHRPTAIPNLKAPLLVTILDSLSGNEQTMKTTGVSPYGKINLYFKVGSQNSDQNNAQSISLTSPLKNSVKEGTRLLLLKSPAIITKTGNPGGFNYKDYAASQKIYYQLSLRPNEYMIWKQESPSAWKKILDHLKNQILHTLNQYIPGKKEAAVAEALLIGYKKNLDKELLQAYSNTGVIHIIAISGLHLGMIYGLLLFLMKPFKNIDSLRWLKPLILLTVIWLFSLLTGASPSILRSAVMFSFIIIGEQQGRTTDIYNSMAASAFGIFCYNPLLLWDIGFQLSYLAVLSIVVFSKKIQRSLYIKNKLLQYCWELCAVTISAQILTFPILLFYFHQFPVLFIFTNFITVPLSGLILYLEIIVLLLSKITAIATLSGDLTGYLIGIMNRIIENSARIPFAVWESIQISFIQTICLYAVILLMSVWLIKKKKSALYFALLCLILFTGIEAFSNIKAMKQQKLIVYYFPQRSAIDWIRGKKHYYLGDPEICQQALLVKNYIEPTRILYKATQPMNQQEKITLINCNNRKIAIIHSADFLIGKKQVHPIDLIIISGSPAISINELYRQFHCKTYVFDCSTPLWKIRGWKKEAESLHLQHHSVPEQGAFEYNF